MTVATVIIPTHDHGPLLRSSVASALAQTVPELEVFLIGDGVPDEAREIARDLERWDGRVRFFDHPKGKRHGEPYRHEALKQAKGKIVCYLSDDDLWFPDHVETMVGLLEDADLAHTLPVVATEGFSVKSYGPYRFQDPLYREIVSRKEWALLDCPGLPDVAALRPALGLTFMGHTLEMYRRLPKGWTTTPKKYWVGRYMWRRFLLREDCRAISGNRPTGIKFPDPKRLMRPMEERVAEIESWRDRLADPAFRERILHEVIQQISETATKSIVQLASRGETNLPGAGV